ncbi:MAG: glycosyltransferase family 4 protein [Cryomorphaceae bacterium]|jgi:glycosyltransferase involved in cell wall biosynthesis|nr:glycosyltransferase family 4 protein [Cryomorphaceae bacterium]
MAQKIVFLVPYPLGSAPSQRFRFEQYFDHLKQQGFELEVYPFYDYQSWQTLYKEGKSLQKVFTVLLCFLKRFGILFKLKKADQLFIHREVAHVGPPLFEWIIAKVLRLKYIYDFDDAIWLPNYSETNSRFHWVKAYWKVNYCMKWAHSVVAGNDYLANYARKFNANVQIIPTTIDTEQSHNQMVNHLAVPLTIGWTGSHTTMRYLGILIPILKKLEQRYNFEFVVISNRNPDFDFRSFRYVKWQKDSEIEDLSKIQIGVMPLEADVWSEGKCGFKGLQYMSMGMATLMSPVGVNNTIIDQGKNGFLVSSSSEWEEKLELLLTDSALRTELGVQGRETILKRFSVESNKANYIHLFKTNK